MQNLTLPPIEKNIWVVSSTFKTSKLEISKDINRLQVENICFIVVTFEVSKLLKSIDKHFACKNIPSILFTLDVSKQDKSKNCIPQLENICFIL